MAVDPGSVRFASICDDEHGFTRSFLLSLLPMLAVDLGGQQRIWRGGYSIQGATSSGVVEGRNEVVREFLESSAEWLFFVDSDMGFDPDALDRLLEVADPQERPIVGGLCFGFGPVGDVLGAANSLIKRPFPTIFDLKETDDDAGFQARWGYIPGQVQQCSATGAALLLIHRTVLETILERDGEVWFNRIKHPKAKKLWGEDTSFCARAGMAGFPVHVHAGVQSSHSKVIHVTQDVYMAELIAQPASDLVDVIVPVLDRPQNAEPFMRSLKASTGLATVWAVCDDHDDVSQKAWGDTGAEVIVMAPDAVGSFSAKVNRVYQGWLTERPGLHRPIVPPWVFLVGDDVRFHPGWLDHAQQVAVNTGAKVIGTNDLGNERVLAGEHAVHMMIARDYIDEVGASWDGPGVICHEGYRHWYVDDEIVTAAKQRGVFAPALASVVEHMHPLWAKGADDETYRRGQRHAGKDKVTFVRRVKEHTS